MKILITTEKNEGKQAAFAVYHEYYTRPKWVELPTDDLELLIEELKTYFEEEKPRFVMIDWAELGFECNIAKYYYIDLYDVNDFAQWFNDLNVWDKDKFNAIIEAYGAGDFDDLMGHMGNFDNYGFYPGRTLKDVAEHIVDESYNLPDIAKRYFDYEAFATDLKYDGYYETEWGVIYVW